MWVWIVLAIVVADVVIAGVVIRYVIANNWNVLASRFPVQPPTEEAVFRAYQSFRAGVLKLGYSVHVTADDAHLHFELVRPLRWMGAKATSIPWSAITIVKRHRNGRWTTARIDPATTITGPAWCLDLADPADRDE